MKGNSICLKMMCLALLNLAFCGLFHLQACAQSLNQSTDTLTVCRSALPVTYHTLLVENAGDYVVSFETGSGTDSVVNLHVVVRENPVPHILGDNGHCVDMWAVLSVDGPYSRILWNTGDEMEYTVTNGNVCSVEVTDEAGCVGSASKELEIWPVPQIALTGRTSLCYGDSTIFKASGVISYYWKDRFGRGISSADSVLYVADEEENYSDSLVLYAYSAQGCVNKTVIHIQTHSLYETVDTVTLCRSELPFHGYYTEGTYPIHYLSESGCDSVVTTTLYIKENPDVRIIGVDSLCQGEMTAITASGAVSYRWNTQSTSLSIVAQPDHLYWVDGVAANGCSARDSVFVRALPLPVVTIEGPSSVCSGETATFYATAGYEYLWSNGSTNASIEVQPEITTTYQVTAFNQHACSATAYATVQVYSASDTSIFVSCCSNELPYVYQDHSFSQSGSYDFTVQTIYGCDRTVHLTLTVLESPYANISGETEICPGTSTKLYANVNAPYVWSTGDDHSPITVYNTGRYMLTVTAANGCKAYDSVEVTHLPIPQLTISGADTICRGSELLLIASGAQTYSWSTGVVGPSISVTPSQSTSYMVTGTSDRGCTATAMHTVRVNAVPTAYIAGIDAICQGNSTVFTASGGISYLWSTGATTASVQLTEEQLYTVEVTNQFGCTATAYKYLMVNALPVVSIVGNAYFCEGGSTVLNAMGTGADSYVWNNVSIGQSYTVSTPGLYTVRATSSANCTATATITVSQQSNPTISINGDLSFCEGLSTQLTASGAQSYVWRNAYGTPLSVSESFVVNEAGSYSVLATSAYACTTIQQFLVTQKSRPTVSITASDHEVCEGSSIILSTPLISGYTYLWNTGATGGQITINTSGTYKLEVTANGCTAEDSIQISMYPLPKAVFTGDTVICYGNTAMVYASTPYDSTYLWSTGATENHISVTPLVSTTYGVSMMNKFGCVNQDSVRVRVEDPPLAAIITAADSMCKGASMILTASGGVNFLWDDSTTTAVRTVTEAGTYSVTVYSALGCSASATKNISYYNDPEITIGGKQNICLADSIMLTVHGGETYLWSNGSTDTCIVIYSEGVYSVEGWDSHACSSRDTVEVGMLPLPEVNITGVSPACPSTTNMLTAQSPTAVSYLWNNGSTTAQIRPTETMVYTVVVSDSNSCKSSASFAFEQLPAPECTILGVNQICQGDTAVLTASNGNYFFWSTLETSRSIRVSPSVTTTYTLVIVGDNGCTANVSKQLVVNEYTPIVITGGEHFCNGDSLLLVAHGSGNMTWSNGYQGDSIVVYESGLYTVTSDDSTSCQLPSSKQVERHADPEVQIVGSTYVCNGDTGVLRAVTNEPVTYLWSNGSVDSAINVSSTNVYSVTVTSMYGCTNSTAQLVMVYSVPTVSVSGPNSVCNGQEINLTATSSAPRLLWSTGDSTASITVKPHYSTTYQVTAYNVYGCSASASLNVNVLPLPIANITGDTVLCQGEVGMLTSSNASSFSWSTGANTRSINVTESGTYTVTLTNSSGCTNSASAFVQVYEQPQVHIFGDSVLCQGAQTVLTATGGTQYLWNDGTTTPFIVVAPENSTMYSVQVTNGICSAEASRTVVVHERPEAHIEAPNGICEGATIMLIAEGGMAYLWSTGQTASMINVSTSGTYQLIAFNQYGCSDTTTQVINQYPNPQVSISGPSAICENAQAVLTVEGEGSALWNTGDMAPSITIHQPGYYYVLLTDSYGCTATTSHVVTSLATPQITIIGPNDICAPATVNLSAVCANTASFYWNTGAVTSTIEVNPTETTTYTVTAVSPDNCTASQSHTIDVHTSYHLEFEAEICQGESYIGYGFNIPVQTAGGEYTFTDSHSTAYGCDSVRILHLTVDAVPVFTSPISGPGYISTTGPSAGIGVYTIDPAIDAVSYEWIISNPNWSLSYNQTIAQVTATTMGVATLSVYALNECGQSLPQTMLISFAVGIDDVETQTVSVYPNPTNGMINLQFSTNNEQLFEGEILLLDIYGKLLNRWEINRNDKQLDLSEYAAGVYMLKLRDTHNSLESVVKVVKQ